MNNNQEPILNYFQWLVMKNTIVTVFAVALLCIAVGYYVAYNDKQVFTTISIVVVIWGLVTYFGGYPLYVARMKYYNDVTKNNKK